MAMNAPERPTPALDIAVILCKLHCVLFTCSVQALVSLSYACGVYQSSYESLKWQ